MEICFRQLASCEFLPLSVMYAAQSPMVRRGSPLSGIVLLGPKLLLLGRTVKRA